jgi:hypothetical protein
MATIIDARSTASRSLKSKYESHLRQKGQDATGTQLGNYRFTNNEATEHHQEQHDTRAFYKAIAESLLPFDEIYLFGPGTAKDELQHFLLGDSHFRNKILRVESSDYTTHNQQVAQVLKHFHGKLHPQDTH